MGPLGSVGPNSAPPLAVYRPTKSACVEQRNLYPTVAVDRIGESPLNGSFSMQLRKSSQEEYAKPALFQHVTSVIDSNISVRSSERERILAASLSIVRGREV